MTPRQRKLSDQAVVHIVRDGRSLRDLAAEYGVSHETIRAARRKTGPAVVHR